MSVRSYLFLFLCGSDGKCRQYVCAMTFKNESGFSRSRVVTRGQDRRTRVVKLVEGTLQRFVADAPVSSNFLTS